VFHARMRARLRVALVAALMPAASLAQAQTLSLDEALRLAGEQSPQLAAQRSGIAAAEQAIVSARELPDPKLFFGVDNLPVNGPQAYSLTEDFMTMRKIGVMQDFPRAEKRELRQQLAERAAAREKLMLVDLRAALRRDVATAWLQRYFAERMGAVVAEQFAETQLQRDALQASVKAGKAVPGDLLSIQLSMQSLLDRKAEFDKQAARAKAALSRWLGQMSERPLAQFTPPAVPADAGVLADHIAHHPHVESLDRQIDMAKAEAALARASVKPDWSLELAYAQRGPAYSNMVSVQVSLDLPLFQRNRQDRDIAARAAQIDQAQQLKDDAIRQHLAEARAAWAEWEAANSRLKLFDESLLPLAQERVKTALAAYRGGRGDLAAVLMARRDVLDLKLQQAQLAQDGGLAYAQLLYFLPAKGEDK